MSPIPHTNIFLKNCSNGDFLAAQWLRLRASNEGGMGSTPGRVTKIPHATWPKKKKTKSTRVIEYQKDPCAYILKYTLQCILQNI